MALELRRADLRSVLHPHLHRGTWKVPYKFSKVSFWFVRLMEHWGRTGGSGRSPPLILVLEGNAFSSSVFLLLSQMATGDPQGPMGSRHRRLLSHSPACLPGGLYKCTHSELSLCHTQVLFPLGSSCEHRDLYLLPGL